MQHGDRIDTPRIATTKPRRLARMLFALGFGLCALGFGPSLAPGASFAHAADAKEGEVEKPSVDAGAVYYGDAARWKTPAQVDADAVYAAIPEYKKIVEEGLEPDDAKYQLLMNRASKRFVAAVRKAAQDGKYDLVARLGAVHGVDDVPDITAAVVENL